MNRFRLTPWTLPGVMFGIFIWGFLCSEDGLSAPQLPPEFKSLVPVCSDCRQVQSRYSRNSVIVDFATADDFESIRLFYQKSLKSSGWKMLLPVKKEELTAVKNKIKFTLSEKSSAAEKTIFTIKLLYPGGRE